MILAGTGHRPDKLGGYGSDVEIKLFNFAVEQLRKLEPVVVISGMALGWDMAIAEAAIQCNIAFDAYIPFMGQESRWPLASQIRYNLLLNNARDIKIISEGGYAVWKMQTRNIAMVDDCTDLLALWNGTSGGTANCLGYARKHNVNIINVWDQWVHN